MGSSLHLHLFMLLCYFHLILLTHSSSFTQPLCHEDERSALLQFKRNFVVNHSASNDPSAYPKVESWKLEGNGNGGDCCRWDGVECDQGTGHVIGLHLASSFLYGSFNSNSSLFNLVHLRRLNLAHNHFNYSQIPRRITCLSRLRSLNLSSSSFSGQIPSEISHLSKLSFLDLSTNDLKLQKPSFRDLVRNLTKLKVLDLSEVNISSTVPGALSNMSSLTALRLTNCQLIGEFPTGIFRLPNLQILSIGMNGNLTGYLPEFHHSSPLKILATEWTSFNGTLPNSIGNLEALSELILRKCYFAGTLPASFGNLTQLTHLSLGLNNFDIGTLPLPLGKLSKLKDLDLEQMNIHGEIPRSLANLTHLSTMDFEFNELVGQIPSWLVNLTRLTSIHFGSNQLQGVIPSSISQLEHLETLDLSWNNLSGEVELDSFLKLRNLVFLLLSTNKLTVLTTKSRNATLSKLKSLGLRSCNLTEFPDFLQFQNEMVFLDLSENKIHGQIPTWFWKASKDTLLYLDLSNNFLTGFERHPDVIPWPSLEYFSLDFNRMQGPLPIPPQSIVVYKVTGNLLTGEIPPSFCHRSNISLVDLSDNNLSGTIPQCLMNSINSLLVLNLSCNNFHGTIPDQTFTTGIKMIDLSQNQLNGEVPRSLTTCTMLQILVLANNQIEGSFPFWLGALPELQVLVLRSNRFHGTIENPETKSKFPKLRIIDLSHNGFSGILPSDYFQNLNTMKMIETDQMLPYMYMYTYLISKYYVVTYMYSIKIVIKGTQSFYERILNAFVAIDLSSNKFSGEIPESLGRLRGLQDLNVSNNNLTGIIPSSLANLTNLESLDMSQNLLSGDIPQQLTQLTFLSVLNLSDNHLAGPIPRGKQFDTFENSSYVGNPELCGDPLSKLCGNSEPPPPRNFQGNDSKFPSDVYWMVIFMGYGSGLIVGLVIGQLLTRRYHEWFVRTFGMRTKNRRREKRKVRRN